MQLKLEPEPHRHEPRFYPETVQKAVALAQRLEQERRETLSLEQVNQLAEELSLDPQLLQQALARVSAEETQQSSVQVQGAVAGRNGRTQATWILLMLGIVLAFFLLLAGYFTIGVAPPAPPTLSPPTAVTVPAYQVPTTPVSPTVSSPRVEGR